MQPEYTGKWTGKDWPAFQTRAFEAVKEYRKQVFLKTGIVPSLPEACKAIAQANPHTFGQVGWVLSHANKACIVPISFAGKEKS